LPGKGVEKAGRKVGAFGIVLKINSCRPMGDSVRFRGRPDEALGCAPEAVARK
jgi:hypothetical protein